MARERLYDIDRAKGLAIFLVVLGHIAIQTQPDVPNWYLLLRSAIYEFHMPFFMFLSGVIFQYTYRPVKDLTEYVDFVISKARRLMPAFFLFGTVTLIGKLMASRIMYVENVPDGVLNGLVAMLITPESSAAGSLWYIYVLFEYYFLFPLLLAFFRGNILLIFLLSIPVYFLPNVPFFLLGAAAKFAIFFAAGVLIMYHRQRYMQVIRTNRWFFMLLFAVSFGAELIFTHGISKMIIGLCSIPALHALVASPPTERSRMLYILGLYAFPIYLMNMIIIGLIKGIILKVGGWSGNLFIIYFVIQLIFGLSIPMIIKKYAIAKIPVLDRITS